MSSRYGYSKERFVWSLISAVGIFCLGSGATIFDGFSNLWKAEVQLLFSAAMQYFVYGKRMSDPMFTANLTAPREHFYCCNGACWIHDYWKYGSQALFLSILTCHTGITMVDWKIYVSCQHGRIPPPSIFLRYRHSNLSIFPVLFTWIKGFLVLRLWGMLYLALLFLGLYFVFAS